jgi:hypothetical protein
MATKRIAKKAKSAKKPRSLAAHPKKFTRAKKAAPKKSVTRRPKKTASPKKKNTKKAGARVATRRPRPARKMAPKPVAKPIPKRATKAKATSQPAMKSPKRKKGRATKPAAYPAIPSPKATPAKKAVRRFDRPGHLDPKYAAELRAQSGVEEKDPRAFLDGPRSPNDDLAEELGEEVVEKATTGEDAGEESLDQVVPEEDGGPFVETSGTQEFAQGTDLSNPKGTFREPFPKT